MTSLASCTVAGTALPTAGGNFTLEELALWNCMVYHKLFANITYQSEQFIERLTFCQKALYRRTDVNQDVLVFTLHFPMQSAAIGGQVDWDVDPVAQGRWLYATQPTSDTNLQVPTAFRTIQPV